MIQQDAHVQSNKPPTNQNARSQKKRAWTRRGASNWPSEEANPVVHGEVEPLSQWPALRHCELQGWICLLSWPWLYCDGYELIACMNYMLRITTGNLDWLVPSGNYVCCTKRADGGYPVFWTNIKRAQMPSHEESAEKHVAVSLHYILTDVLEIRLDSKYGAPKHVAELPRVRWMLNSPWLRYFYRELKAWQTAVWGWLDERRHPRPLKRWKFNDWRFLVKRSCYF